MSSTLSKALVIPRIVLVIGLLMSSIALAGDTILTDDAFTYSARPTQPFGQRGFIVIAGPSQPGIACTYLKFDLATLRDLSTGDDVEKATLSLWVNRVLAGGSFDVYPVEEMWTEDTLTDAKVPGTSDLPQVSATISVTDVNHFVTIDVTVLVREWVSGALPNNGIALVARSKNIAVVFDSKENKRLLSIIGDHAA
jgi:hypothetical protein